MAEKRIVGIFGSIITLWRIFIANDIIINNGNVFIVAKWNEKIGDPYDFEMYAMLQKELRQTKYYKLIT